MNPLWSEPGLIVAWGVTSGQWTPADLAQMAHDNGVKSVCYQVIPENDGNALALHDACRSLGLRFGGWTNVPQQVGSDAQMAALLDRINAYKCGFFAANVEERWTFGDGSRNGCHAAFTRAFRSRFPKKPACVQTNFGGFDAIGGGYDRTAAAIYWQRHFDCQHEDYMNDNPNATPLEGDFVAHNQLGFPRPSSSLIGLYHGWTIGNYRDALLASGRKTVQWIYLPEEMVATDWPLIGKPL